jgi:hypothetical protein
MYRKKHKTIYERAWDIYQLVKIVWGYYLYCRIQRHFPKSTVLIYDYSGIGDVYVFCLYIKANYDKIAEGNFVIVFNNKVLCKIFNLFELKNFFFISKINAKHLTHFSLVAPDILNVRNITPFPRYNFTDLSFRFGGVFLNMAEMYKYQMFNLPETASIEYPVLKPDRGEVEEIFTFNGLIDGKTVILSPIAKTCIGYSDAFWKNLAQELKFRGFVVCTNTIEKKDVIEGTIPIFFSFQNSEAVLNRAGLFIALRSGLCDVVCNTECKKIILYPEYRIFNSSLYDFCSLEKMGIGKNYIEIVEPPDNEKKLLCRVLENIGE